MSQPLVALNVRVPENLKALMREFVARGTHNDISELTRDAIRDKIRNEAPELFKKVFGDEQTNEPNSENNS